MDVECLDIVVDVLPAGADELRRRMEWCRIKDMSPLRRAAEIRNARAAQRVDTFFGFDEVMPAHGPIARLHERVAGQPFDLEPEPA